MKIKIIIGFILLHIALSAYNFYSPMIKWELLNVIETNKPYKLDFNNIIINSERVYNDSLTLKKNEYQIDYKKGEITFKKAAGNCKIEYYVYPKQLIDRFFLYKVQQYSDSTKVKINKQTQRSYQNTDLDITGSKTLSVSVSNDQNFDLDQSLFLKINGKLSDEMSIEAQLSDSQTPITPEGDSRELSSLDKIFIRLYGRSYELAFGDLEMKFDNSEYLNFSTKFEGLKAGWSGKHNFKGALAVSKGKKVTDSFNGIEAKQGPYYLSVEGTTGVLVVPGSEEVYLNGQLMQRGTDYTIDYSEGGITFANKHFISSTSKIRVLFQYADEDYKQNMYLASADLNFTEKFKISNNIIIQTDDKNNPLQESFTDTEIDALKETGDEEAWVSGIVEYEDGEYQISEDGLYYYYVGADTTTSGNYNIHFEDVGSGNGDYSYNSTGSYYEYVGNGNGSYLPLKELPLPQRKFNNDISVSYKGETYNLLAEGLLTYLDKNTFSEKDDKDNFDLASRFSVRFFPNYDLIDPKLKLAYERRGKNISSFVPLQNAVDAYEFTQLPDSLNSDEYSAELSMNIDDTYSPYVIFKHKRSGDTASQQYFSVTSNINQKKFFPQLYHRYLLVEQTSDTQQIINSNIQQHDLRTKYSFTKMAIGTDYYLRDYEYENFDGIPFNQHNSNWKIQLETLNLKWLSSRIFGQLKEDEIKFTSDDEVAVQLDETSYTYGFETYISTTKHRINIALTHREVDDKKQNTSKGYDIADISSRNSFIADFITMNSNYSLRNVEFFPKIKEFLYVGEDLGAYDIDTLFVGEFQGDYDWEIVDIDYENPEMSVEINGNLSINLTPKLITDSFLRKFQAETYLMITENSREENKSSVYFLDPQVLMNSQTTIFGRRSVHQTIWYDILEKKLNSKFGYKLEETLDSRYNAETLKTETETYNSELRILMIPRSNLELHFDHIEEKDSQYNSQLKTDQLSIDVQNRLSSDLTIKTSASLSNEEGNDDALENSYKIRALQFEASCSYFYKRKYRFFARASYKNNKRDGSGFLSFLSEKREGNIFKWDLTMDYRMSNYTSLNLNYSGNSYPDEDQLHKLSVEIKAEF